MDGDETNTGASDESHDGSAGPCWYRPLGSAAAGRLLTELVVDRLHLVSRSRIETDALVDGTGVVEVDPELGVVRTRDRRWSAALAPLAVRLAHIPPDGWSTVIDREIRRWNRAVTAVDELGSIEQSRHLGPGVGPVELRLAASIGVGCPTTRPAFGDTVWELVLDLGSGGYAAVNTTCGAPGRGSEQRWSRFAAETVNRHEEHWAHLMLDDISGVVISGPFVSSLLYDSGVLRARLDQPLAGLPLRVTVFTNSLLVVLSRRTGRHPAADEVTESLRRFTSDHRRRFEPFTVDLADPVAPPTPDQPA